MARPRGFSIDDLRACPHFAAVVADRVWRAWWREQGVALATIAQLVGDALGDAPVPSTLVAFAEKRFLGTASLIACDLDARSSLAPWVAAVWVEPTARNRGVGAGLVAAATATAFNSGADKAYLCALASKRAYYERLGWIRLEEDVGESRLTVLYLGKESPQGR